MIEKEVKNMTKREILDLIGEDLTCPHSMYHPECYSCCFNYLGM